MLPSENSFILICHKQRFEGICILDGPVYIYGSSISFGFGPFVSRMSGYLDSLVEAAEIPICRDAREQAFAVS